MGGNKKDDLKVNVKHKKDDLEESQAEVDTLLPRHTSDGLGSSFRALASPRDSMGEAVHSIATNWFSRTFMSGCAILLPVVITVTATKWLVELVDSIFSPVYVQLFHIEIFGLGFLTAIILIFVAGIFGQSYLGSLLIRVSEWVLEKIPFVTQIYSAAKQIGQAIDPRTSSGAFQECVLIKHPRHGEYALAFVTGECRLQGPDDERKLIIVYVPTNHMYVGDIFMLGPDDIVHTSMTVSEGLEVVVSMGMAMPKSLEGVEKSSGRSSRFGSSSHDRFTIA